MNQIDATSHGAVVRQVPVTLLTRPVQLLGYLFARPPWNRLFKGYDLAFLCSPYLELRQ